MNDDIGNAMRVVQLESQLTQARNVVSRAVNTLEQVKIAINDDDTEEALRIIADATGERDTAQTVDFVMAVIKEGNVQHEVFQRLKHLIADTE